jgi:uncharacterized protein (DUF58 family)
MRQPNFARLNHVLIPSTKEGRDRIRSGWVGKVFFPLTSLIGGFTDEGRAVALLTFVVGGFGIDVRNTEIYVLWAMLSGALAASILVRPLYGLRREVLAELSVPRRVLAHEDLVFGVVLSNRSPRDLRALRVSGPFLPWDGRWTESGGGVSCLRVGETARVELRARFVARGEHHLDAFHVAALVPFGLAAGRSVATPGARFLVLPRIARVSRLTLPEGRREQGGGAMMAARMGASTELLGVRPYRPGDPVRHLHARSWARTGVPIVREYQEEVFRRIAVVLDVDPADEACAEAAISLAAGVVAHLVRGGVGGEWLVDLVVAGRQVHDLALGRGPVFLEQALEVLACVEIQPRTAARTSALLAHVESRMARVSNLVVVDTASSGPTVTDPLRAMGLPCAWLRVDRVDRVDRGKSDAGLRTVSPDAVERGEELAL